MIVVDEEGISQPVVASSAVVDAASKVLLMRLRILAIEGLCPSSLMSGFNWVRVSDKKRSFHVTLATTKGQLLILSLVSWLG